MHYLEMRASIVHRPKRKRVPMAHIDDGFPHRSSYDDGHCMCISDCCQDDEKGCICKECPCRYGKPHPVNVLPFNGRKKRS